LFDLSKTASKIEPTAFLNGVPFSWRGFCLEKQRNGTQKRFEIKKIDQMCHSSTYSWYNLFNKDFIRVAIQETA
jgi:hypothetical protein